jgi:hypothetical protein
MDSAQHFWEWINRGSHAAALSAIGALVGLIISLWFSWRGHRRSRFALGVDVLLKQEDRFNNGADMLRARPLAAEALLRHEYNDCVDDVLDFFETIAILTRKGAIDEDLVWHTFFYWIEGYYQAAERYIRTEQREWPTTWEDLTWLYKKLCKIERRKEKCSDEDIINSDDELKEFLELEKRINQPHIEARNNEAVSSSDMES